jgi:hypothetical protein
MPIYWHDWMVRDFFAYLLSFNTPSLYAILPGIQEIVSFDTGWKEKVIEAYKNASLACYYEKIDVSFYAQDHWKNIFGPVFAQTNNSIFTLSGFGAFR